MNSEQRIENLFLIKEQLEKWLAYQPEWHMQLHGCGEANIAYQCVKQLIQHELQVQALEESVAISQSLGLYNLE